ncbi:pilus assembly protein TadG-related protein [Sphingomonas sp. LR60]|uniref:pilus assembly protein n=1 Tax=Sphingomonas sp. LR60 TaxID=3050233 RepID=UPI002FE3F5C8
MTHLWRSGSDAPLTLSLILGKRKMWAVHALATLAHHQGIIRNDMTGASLQPGLVAQQRSGPLVRSRWRMFFRLPANHLIKHFENYYSVLGISNSRRIEVPHMLKVACTAAAETYKLCTSRWSHGRIGKDAARAKQVAAIKRQVASKQQSVAALLLRAPGPRQRAAKLPGLEPSRARPGNSARLLADSRGNVMALWAFMLIPLVGLIGSAVDLGAGYVTREQMQVACDAAVLAGRRAMTNGVVDDAVRAEATKFFNFNFRQGIYGADPFVPSVTSTSGSKTTVYIQASTTVPTSIMRMFGFRTLPVSVSCNASQDFVNTDIVFVLDTTGSMADKATSSDTSSKIDALRSAVLALYDQLASVQTQLSASGMRLRYGVVPYASATNVGRAIRAANTDYMLSTNWNYWTRRVVTDYRSSSSCTSAKGNYDSNQGTCTYFDYSRRMIDISGYVAGNSVDVTP